MEVEQMAKIYNSMSDFEEAQEKEFREKVEVISSLSYYQGDTDRTTIDKEWTESELKDDLWSEAKKVLDGDKNKSGWLSKNKFKAVYDEDLKKIEYLVEHLASELDLIEIYNGALDKHRNDKPMLFGIHYFDEAIRAEILKVLNNNLVSNG